MTNKYLEKIADFVRPLEGLVSRTNGLKAGIASRERRINMGLSSKPAPTTAAAKLSTLQDQSHQRKWSN
jgi:hypothetical protein